MIIAARRSAIGRAGGIFADVPTEDLAAPVLQAALADARLQPHDIDDVILGNAAGPGGNIARLSALNAGFPVSVPGMTIDRQCGAGLEAIITACRFVAAQAGELYLAGGVESVSQAPLRANRPTGDTPPEFYTRARFSPDTVGDPDMGVAAENVAQKYAISRARQDAFAQQSQSRAVQAQAAGAFDAEIVPVCGYFHDECPRKNTSLEKLATLRPVFWENGTVTAGNTCPLNDGASVVVVTSLAKARTMGVARVLGFVDAASAGVDPNLLGIGPVASTQKLLRKRPDISLDALTHLEFNEAFAAQVLASLDELGLRDDLPNTQGGAIALGHPFGASGAILVTRLFSQLVRHTPVAQPPLAMAMIGIGGGLGLTAAFEPLSLS